MKVRSIATTMALVISAGSAAQAQEYRRATNMERVQAVCHQVGASAERGHFAFGSPLFVAISGIASAIGNGIEHQQAYDNCMTYYGFVRSDSAAVTPNVYRTAPAGRMETSEESQPSYAAPHAAQTIQYKRYKLGG